MAGILDNRRCLPKLKEMGKGMFNGAAALEADLANALGDWAEAIDRPHGSGSNGLSDQLAQLWATYCTQGSARPRPKPHAFFAVSPSTLGRATARAQSDPARVGTPGHPAA